jgi:multiple sugar transport system ATP-binding protein
VPRVILDSLAKVFNRSGGEPICALSAVSLTVEDKESLVIVGPSGSGKTTLLRLIAGLESPTSGTIAIGGKIVNAVPPGLRDVAMVFQSPVLYPHMSVYENIAFGLRLRRCPRPELDTRVREAARILGLTGWLAAKPMALSGGQRQRVAIGRAIVRRASVFLCDEPLANIDPALRGQMRTELTSLVRELGTTMVYVTHDHTEALMLGDRVAVLRDGQLQQISDPVGLYHRPANLFVAEFIGNPPMNLFRGLLLRRGGVLLFEAEPDLRLPLEPTKSPGVDGCLKRSIILGIRPEHIALRAPGPHTAPEEILEGKVLGVQRVGPDTFLQFRAGEASFVARVPGGTRVSAGQICALSFDLGQAHFFDPTNGKAIPKPCVS